MVPTADAWNLKPDPTDHAGGPTTTSSRHHQPAPITTIGWRLVHIIADNEVLLGVCLRTPTTHIPRPHRAQHRRGSAGGLARQPPPHHRVAAHANDADLAEPRPSHLGDVNSAGEVVRILLDEQIHHGAEIALLRDLYQRRQNFDPLSHAGIHGLR